MATLNAREKRAERRARGGAAMDMNLVSLIDVFTILIFFLLSSATGVETLVSPKAVELPLANADTAPRDTVLLVVAGGEILAEGRRVALVDEALAAAGDDIPGLRTALAGLATRQAVRPATRNAQAARGQAVTIMADKDLPYRLLRKVMATCAGAGYSDVSFAVRKRFDA